MEEISAFKKMAFCTLFKVSHALKEYKIQGIIAWLCSAVLIFFVE